jgi:inosine-uridine nucleoside N-ribohydrolase
VIRLPHIPFCPWVIAPLLAIAVSAKAAVPVINITDLYHGYQDSDDNLDLPMAYSLPEVDLKAVILDATKTYMGPHPAEGVARAPGQIPVEQMNLVFGRNVPYAYTPFTAMTSLTDTLSNAPANQQSGINLLLNTLRKSPEPVHIVSFGSARVLAAAYNREPELMRQKVAKIYLLASSQPSDSPSGPWCPEWDVKLDPYAFERVITSDLPVAMCPGQAANDPFAVNQYNTYWKLPNTGFIKSMPSSLQSYLAFAYGKTMTSSFLPALNQKVTDFGFTAASHNVWNTAIWLAVTGRKLVQHKDGHYEIVAAKDVRSDDVVLPNDLLPVRLQSTGNGQYGFSTTTGATNKWQYSRGNNPAINQTALQEAVPKFYAAMIPDTKNLGRMQPVAIQNSSFEAVSLSVGGFTSVKTGNGIAGWKTLTLNAGQDAGTLRPSRAMYSSVPDGNNVLYLLASSTSGSTKDTTLIQELSVSLQPNTHYVLSALVGQRLDRNCAGYKVQLFSGDQLLAEDNNAFPLTPGFFIPTVVTYDTNGTVLPGNLSIRLVAINGQGIENQVNFASVDFQAIQIPEPSSAVVVGCGGLTLLGYCCCRVLQRYGTT